MKIVNILGGLGNQMFQYAFYLALKDAHPQEEIKVCTRSYRGYKLHNGLEIDRVFGLNLPEATVQELQSLAYPFFSYRTWQMMRHFLPTKMTMSYVDHSIPFDFFQVLREDSVFYDGYWQNEGYFHQIREQILKTFAFPPFVEENNLALAKTLSSCNAVSCHIRRGDYLKCPDLCVCTPSYYSQAFQKINSLDNPDLYVVFSDDIPWCSSVLSRELVDHNVVFVDWNKGVNSFRDMQLMSLCKHHIIANSSFSWWGAWLGKDTGKIVISPSVFSRRVTVNDPICSDWIRIAV